MWCWDDVKCWGLWCCDVDCWVLWFYDDVKLSVMMLWWFNDECWDDEKCCDDMMMWCWVLCWDDTECKIGRVYNWKSEGCSIGMCDFMDYIRSIIFWIFSQKSCECHKSFKCFEFRWSFSITDPGSIHQQIFPPSLHIWHRTAALQLPVSAPCNHCRLMTLQCCSQCADAQ